MSLVRRDVFALASRLLEYPDDDFFAALPGLKEELRELDTDENTARAAENFLDAAADLGPKNLREHYVAVFDHDPQASPRLSWHRYGNDRAQGKAMAALNGLYRCAGFEPEREETPDYLPKLLEFFSVCEAWAIETALDGFGPEMANIAKHLTELESPYRFPLTAALDVLRAEWPDRFQTRLFDPTARPAARPEPEDVPVELTRMAASLNQKAAPDTAARRADPAQPGVTHA